MKTSCRPPTRCGRGLADEPGVVDVDDVREAAQRKLIFVTDKEKAALSGITTGANRRHASGRAGRRHGGR